MTLDTALARVNLEMMYFGDVCRAAAAQITYFARLCERYGLIEKRHHGMTRRRKRALIARLRR